MKIIINLKEKTSLEPDIKEEIHTHIDNLIAFIFDEKVHYTIDFKEE